MPSISLRGYHAFVNWVASPIWRYIVCPFYRYTLGTVWSTIYNAFTLNVGSLTPDTAQHATVNGTTSFTSWLLYGASNDTIDL